MTNQNQIVELLRDKVSKDPVTSAVLHMWALRQRARNQVTLNGLMAKMKREGFMHDKRQYESTLRFLAYLGFGRLQTDSKDRVVALRDVETTLQSIGKVACDPKGDNTLHTYHRKNRFSVFQGRRPSLNSVMVDSAPVVPPPPPPENKKKGSIRLVITKNGNDIAVPLEAQQTAEEILHLISCFKKML